MVTFQGDVMGARSVRPQSGVSNGVLYEAWRFGSRVAMGSSATCCCAYRHAWLAVRSEQTQNGNAPQGGAEKNTHMVSNEQKCCKRGYMHLIVR